MNVLHVTPSLSPEWGGPAYSVPSLVSALIEEGIGSEIVTTRGIRVGRNPIAPDGVQTRIFDTQFPARIWTAYSRGLSRFVHDEVHRFDLVHASEVWHHASYAAFKAARKRGVPFVMSIRGELSEWSLQHKAWKKRIYMTGVLRRMLCNADALHAITVAEEQQLRRLGIETPIIIAPNGIDSAQFDNLPDTSEFLLKFPILKGKRILLFLGRLNPKKGLEVLAHSFSRINRKFENSALLVVGPNEYGTQQRMEAILDSEGALDSTVFTGLLTGNEKLAAMACADIFVLPSYSDVLGIAALEAMAARLPVVITEGCEFPEVAEHGAGLVVKPNEESVSNALGELLTDAKLRRRMGERGRKLIEEQYTWHATATAISELYKSLVTDSRPVL